MNDTIAASQIGVYQPPTAVDHPGATGELLDSDLEQVVGGLSRAWRDDPAIDIDTPASHLGVTAASPLSPLTPLSPMDLSRRISA